MNPNDREDSSKYVNQNNEDAAVRSIEAESTAASAARAPKPKKSKAPVVLGMLLVVALVAAAVLGWLWYQQRGEVDSVRADLSSARDKVAQLESAEEAETTPKEDESTVTTDTTGDESEEIITQALKYSTARTGNRMYPDDPSTRQGVIDKQDAEFAKVTVTASGTPSPSAETIYLKKANDSWIVIGDDSEDIEQLEIRFGLPENF